MSTVQENSVVSIHYQLSDGDGRVIENSRDGDQPMSYLHGQGNIIPGLEQALTGREVGESLKVSVPPAEAYGEVREDLVQNVPREAFGEVEPIEPGMAFQARSPDGRETRVVVKEIADDQVIVDANHQLAGVTLNFDVEVVEVRDATEEELAHGHAH